MLAAAWMPSRLRSTTAGVPLLPLDNLGLLIRIFDGSSVKVYEVLGCCELLRDFFQKRGLFVSRGNR